MIDCYYICILIVRLINSVIIVHIFPNSLDMSEDKKMNANPINWSILPYTASISSCVLGAQKNALIETVLLSTQNTCFGLETKNVRKLIFEVHKTSQFSYSD